MTPFEPGEVVLIRFPFTDLSAVKKRPAVVVSPRELSTRHEDVTLIALTSQPQNDPDLSVQDLQCAGLPRPTWLKPLIATISANLIDRRLGRLAPVDESRVQSTLRRLIAAKFAV